MNAKIPPPFAKLYRNDFGGCRGFREAWGAAYSPPVEFEHGVWHRIAFLPRDHEDGFDVVVDECRMPARFYRVTALPKVNHRQRVPAVVGGYTLSTGSSQEPLVIDVAAALRYGLASIGPATVGN